VNNSILAQRRPSSKFCRLEASSKSKRSDDTSWRRALPSRQNEVLTRGLCGNQTPGASLTWVTATRPRSGLRGIA